MGLPGRRVRCESVLKERRSERASATRLEPSQRDLLKWSYWEILFHPILCHFIYYYMHVYIYIYMYICAGRIRAHAAGPPGSRAEGRGTVPAAAPPDQAPFAEVLSKRADRPSHRCGTN